MYSASKIHQTYKVYVYVYSIIVAIWFLIYFNS